ncbi:MFS transporter [Methylovorus menthalis]|uniref:MFS transporter n=1 Tax=Methylovorus menthalis TaxID=1002227 RepID=UPI001E5DC452|nr:MFS transporter [Methylovorus menthalis]MCB4812056.1 MFS transporter [Methylovorus menthalis]
MPLAIYALTIGSFGIGITEFVIMGLLPEVGSDMGVTLSQAGYLVSGYALGVMIGAPLMIGATGSMARKQVLLWLMVIFTIGNLACAMAPEYWSLLLARVVTSFAHGAFFGIGSVVATSLVPREKQASAIALMFTGLTLANVLGVPLGTWVGQLYGWRTTFVLVTVVGVLAVMTIGLLLPRDSRPSAAPSFASELRVLRQRQVLLGLGMTVFGFGGLFAVFTYIAPVLTGLAGFSAQAVSPILLVFGVGLVLGNWAGGKAADHRLMPTLIGTIALLMVCLFGFGWAMQSQVMAVIGVALLGVVSFATVPALQMRVLEKASAAPNLAAALNIGAFNLGNAIGAWLGGLVIDYGNGLPGLHYAAALMALVGLLLAVYSAALDKRSSPLLAKE